MPDLPIRPVTRADVAELIENVLGEAGRAIAERRVNEHEGGYRQMLVAELEGQIVGTVSTGGSGHQLAGSLRMFALDVGDRFRGQGIGAALVEAVEARARELGLERVNLEVSVDNEGAISLYERLGYEIVEGPIDETWQRPLPDGTVEQVADRLWVMVKRVGGDRRTTAGGSPDRGPGQA